MLLFSEKRIGKVDRAQSASLKNVLPSSVFEIEDCICGVEKESLYQSYQQLLPLP